MSVETLIIIVVVVIFVFWTESKGLRPMREHTLRGVQFFLRRAVPTGISSASAGLLLYALVWQSMVWSRSPSRLPPGTKSTNYQILENAWVSSPVPGILSGTLPRRRQ